VVIERDVVTAGGGPAGMVAGYLFARAGLRVTVLEKHADFLRDFRGDTIHPSTISVLRELGVLDRFLALPLSRITTMDAVLDGRRLTLVDFATLPSPDDFLVFAPQWDFLTFLVGEGAKLPGFEVRLSTEATGLIERDGKVTGLRAEGPDGELEFGATLVVAADGRGSRIRDAAGFAPTTEGVPIDVLWFALPKPADPPPPTLGYVDGDSLVLTIERGDHYQSGMVIEKGGFDRLQSQGIDALRHRIVATAPVLAPVVGALRDWDQIKLLSVQLDHLPRWWRDGLICIGDASHAMSPVMGVGINYAIQDAVALANASVPFLRAGAVPTRVLDAVQRRRQRPVAMMQRIQRLAHGRISRPAHGKPALSRAERALLVVAQPVLRRVLARLVGRGFLPEHVNLTVVDPVAAPDRRA
jgi:2-polyprenyl-6-methoxyphenol hydroxylase-like FAD-dependent oxidoreductase